MSDRLEIDETDSPKRARSLSPARGRGRSRDIPKRRISRSASRALQPVWALNPMVNVDDAAFEAAATEDDSFREAVTRARAASQSRLSEPTGDDFPRSSSPVSGMDRLRSSSPSGMERLSASSVAGRTSYSADPLMGKPNAYKVTSSYNGGNPEKYNGSSPEAGFIGRKLGKKHSSKYPEVELKLVAQKSEELVLAIAVQPPTPNRGSGIGKHLLGKQTLEGYKRNSRSATESSSIHHGTQCPECKAIIPGSFQKDELVTCTSESCQKQFKAHEQLLVAECQACFTWALIPKGVTALKCSVCRIDVELLGMHVHDVPEISRHSASEHFVDGAVHGILSAWELIRAGAHALLPRPVKSVFINWSATIVTDYAVLEPRTDDEIRKLIFEAQAAGLTLRVLGHGHSQSPAVCGNNEPGVLIIRLNKYKQLTSGIPDFEWVRGEQGEPTRDVRINAGWSIAQLYAETVHKGYFLFSQTAACPFSVGGVYMNAVHGSAHSESFLATRCVGLRVIKYDGSIVTIDKESDLRMWRCNMGLGGVTTHVIIRMRRFTSITNSHVKFKLELTPEKVQSCIFDSLGGYHACEFFWDPYSNDLMIARWRGENDGGVSNFEKKARKHQRLDSLTHGISIGGDDFVQLAPETAKRFESREVNLQAAFAGMEHFLRRDASGKNSMFIVDWVPRCVFLAYFIPIRSSWDVIRALKAVKEVVDWGIEHQQQYGINCPVEFRFVRGNSSAMFTPLWEPENPDMKEEENGSFTKKQLWMNIEVIAYTSKLDQTFSPRSHIDKPLTASWQEFWYRVEQNWRKIEGAKPHPAKLFGIEPRPGGGYRAFAPQYVHEVWSATQKKEIHKWLHETDPAHVFQRQFVKHMLADASPLDRIDGDDILTHATKLPDATKTTVNNINDYKGLWFVFITLPYWLSGMVVHSAGFIMLVVLVAIGFFQTECNEKVLGYNVRDCGLHPMCTTTSLRWIQAWFVYRGLIGVQVAPFHLIINCRRVGLLAAKSSDDEGNAWSKPNTDDNSKMFWRCVPICDIMISFTMGLGIISMQHMYECGLTEFFWIECICMLILAGVLGTRIGMRLKGHYYRFFHYNGNGAFFAQKSIKGSWNPWHRLKDSKFV